MQAGQILATALAAIGFVAAAFASLHALLNKRGNIAGLDLCAYECPVIDLANDASP